PKFFCCSVNSTGFQSAGTFDLKPATSTTVPLSSFLSSAFRPATGTPRASSSTHQARRIAESSPRERDRSARPPGRCPQSVKAAARRREGAAPWLRGAPLCRVVRKSSWDGGGGTRGRRGGVEPRDGAAGEGRGDEGAPVAPDPPCLPTII